MSTLITKLEHSVIRIEDAIRKNKGGELRQVMMIGGVLISLWLFIKFVRFCMQAIFYFPNYGMPEYPTVIVKSDRDE